MTKHILTITGPSLSGKTQLSKILQEQYNFHAVVSVTTRPQRANEINGIDYYFINQEEYNSKNLIQKTHFNNYHYGVAESEVVGKSEQPIIWVVAPESVEQIENYCINNDINLTKLFITNPEKVLFARLLERFKNDNIGSVDTYVKRLQSMTNKEKQWVIDANNIPGKYDIVINSFNAENSQEVIKNLVNYFSKNNEAVNGSVLDKKVKIK